MTAMAHAMLVMWSLLQSTIVHLLFNEPEAFASTVVLMFFFGLMAMLQSRLTTAAGAWQQYEAAVMDLRTPQPTSACTTTTAELRGNKGGVHNHDGRATCTTTAELRGNHDGRATCTTTTAELRAQPRRQSYSAASLGVCTRSACVGQRLVVSESGPSAELSQ